MDDLIVEFITETGESLGELDNSLILLEQDPGNADLLSKIFRVMHTIKGTCGFLALPRLEKVAHKSEDLLGLFRDGQLTPNPAYISLILESLDRIKQILGEIEKSGAEQEGDDTMLIAKLEVACDPDMEAAFASQSAPRPAAAPIPAPIAVAVEIPPSIEFEAPVTQSAPAPVAAPPSVQAEAGPVSDHTVASQSLRVSVDVLENLMTMVSELVLTRNQILQVARQQADNGMAASLQRLNLIVSDLQEGVMKTRMQPVGNAWSKLPRIVRDISSELGKKIELEMHGQDTELDRQVLEMIKDPLTHMVRNAADHGIETPAERLAAGKIEQGRIRLDSWHEGGHIIIEIADDGKGLAIERIKRKIVQNGLAGEAELAAMTTQQIQQFIFHAGFSTAEKITSVSGRGVGMDVVRSNIEKINGSISMNSTEGQGTVFTIKIPLTLAIVSALIVGVGAERYAIPQLDVRELVMTGNRTGNRIETLNGARVLRLRDRLLPLVCLRDLLGLGHDLAGSEPKYIAVIRVGSASYGLIVDCVFDTEEIVVKPVSRMLRQQQVFSGNTILGDGQVIMIIDPSGVMRAAGMTDAVTRVHAQEEKPAARTDSTDTGLLLFMAGGKSMKGIPLKHVSRLEEIDLARVETAGGQRVIQYGNMLMPVFSANGRDLPPEGKKPVIVFATRTGLAGLVVEQILDVTAFDGALQLEGNGDISGSAIIDGKATDILNLSRHQGEAQAHVSIMETFGLPGGDATDYPALEAYGAMQ